MVSLDANELCWNQLYEFCGYVQNYRTDDNLRYINAMETFSEKLLVNEKHGILICF